LSEKHKIKLGPLLGIEGDYSYTVTFLSDFDIQLDSIFLNLKFQSNQKDKIAKCNFKEKLHKSFVYKFEFDVTKNKENFVVEYCISDKQESYFSEHDDNWKFEVPGLDVIPKIGIASCNGAGNRPADPKSEEQFFMWKRLRKDHLLGTDKNHLNPFHCLLLTGDQIYADLLWKEIEYFEKHKLLGWRKIFNGSKKITEHKIHEDELEGLSEQLYEFYEKTYIQSWSNVDIAAVLASVPSVMMWDDHDIFDGWGSHYKYLQESDLFKLIFKVAKEFFEKLQIRGSINKTRTCISRNKKYEHYTCRLSFRNFEILILDNRSQRTQKQIMSGKQYEELDNILCDTSFFSKTSGRKSLTKDKTILFVIPVPIAHLDYSNKAENFLKHISKLNFQQNFSLGDDALDHWAHDEHSSEQKYLIDLIFRFGEVFSPTYIHIISGDVHSAGVGRIKRLKSEITEKWSPHGKDYLRVNQLVTSAIVHHPVGKIVQFFINILTSQTKNIEGYDIWVDDYGKPDKRKTIYERNFGYLEKRNGEGLKFYLELESSTTKIEPKNDEVVDYNFDQPAKFEDSTAKD